MKKCKNCKNKFEPKYSSVEMFCSPKCAYTYKKENTVIKSKPKKIPQFSKKRQELNKVYSEKRKIFLSKENNKICPITNMQTTDIHHKKGRIGYADEYAIINDIPLLLDERFWVALSREGHRFVEDNTEWAKLNGYSVDRNK